VDAALCPTSPLRAILPIGGAVENGVSARGPFGPEALGSPAGLCCPAGVIGLLWPHPSLLTPTRRLYGRASSGGYPLGTEESQLSVACPVLSVPSALPRRIRRLTCRELPPTGAFARCTERLGIRVSGQKNRFTPAAYFRGCNSSALMLRPGSLLALHRQGRFTFRAFHPMSHLTGTSNITTRANSQFPRPDLHRQDKQPCWLHRYV